MSEVINRMQTLIHRWEDSCDDRTLFLNCYQTMTGNMLEALHAGEFRDSAWVDRLLHRFADYYFDALEIYDSVPASSPAVWQAAHSVCCDGEVTALQKILLGINAHINYDLVLTLDDMLRPEWGALPESHRAVRYADHCYVNDVIGRSIDAVQDNVLDPAMPLMDYVDRFLGPVDEYLISVLITRWRESVWTNAVTLVSIEDEREKQRFIGEVERETLGKAAMICQKAAGR